MHTSAFQVNRPCRVGTTCVRKDDNTPLLFLLKQQPKLPSTAFRIDACLHWRVQNVRCYVGRQLIIVNDLLAAESHSDQVHVHGLQRQARHQLIPQLH